jgi:hypothetical protein
MNNVERSVSPSEWVIMAKPSLKYGCTYIRGQFEKFIDLQQCAAVMQREVVTYAKL